MADTNADKPSEHRPSRIVATLRALIRTRVTAGVLVVLPLWVTVLLIKFVFEMMRDSSQWVILGLLRNPWVQEHVLKIDDLGESKTGLDRLLTEYPKLVDNAWFNTHVMPLQASSGGFDVDRFLAAHPVVDWSIAIFSVFLTIFILYAVGLFAANIFGRRLISFFEHAVDRVPLVKTVYRSSKQILITFTGDQSQSFQRVALVPFPQEKMRCVGFITAIFRDSVTGEELATVFIPTTPNPTTGYLQIMRRAELVELDWTVEDAVRTIMSGGILRPNYLTIVPGAQSGPSPMIAQPESAQVKQKRDDSA